MWPFSKPTIADLQSKAYIVYHEFGANARIPREQRLLKKFSSVGRTTIKIWLDQFSLVDSEVGNFVGTTHDFDRIGLKIHLAGKFPFMNDKALEKAAFMGWFWTR
ncbi:MAG: hypothetical protein WKF92_10205 [Pyrinomonadaceae bacterium]